MPSEAASNELVQRAEAIACETHALRRFPRFAELEGYVQSVVLGSWWCERFPAAPLEVRVLRRTRSATFSAAHEPDAGLGVIHIVDGRGWGLETILHELAHLAAGVGAGHGPRFRDALLELWRHEAGIEAWAVLRGALDAAAAD